VAKREKLFSKILVILLLVFIVVGFTVPAFFNDEDDRQTYVEPRICQNDADCYLLCDNVPIEALCARNLCQQNACGEFSYYSFNETPVVFTLAINVNDSLVDLASRKSERDLFVTFTGGDTNLFSHGLSLAHVLEKVEMSLDAECLYVGDQTYCQSAKKELKMLVNGEQVYSFGGYVPEDGDKAEIIHS